MIACIVCMLPMIAGSVATCGCALVAFARWKVRRKPKSKKEEKP